jgi:hypothetical protein
MIELLIFELHILAAIFAFTKSWQYKSIKEGFLAVAMIGLVFSIAWAITGTLANVIYPQAWRTPYFNQNTLSLVLLVIPEIFFFYHFFLVDKETVNNKID